MSAELSNTTTNVFGHQIEELNFISYHAFNEHILNVHFWVKPVFFVFLNEHKNNYQKNDDDFISYFV